MKRFNTTGLCIPHKHYMVNIDERVQQIRAMVDRGDYFEINRGRQYGKTTTLAALEHSLTDEYGVIRLDFQAISTSGYRTEGRFVSTLCRILWRKRSKLGMPEQVQADVRELARMDEDKASLDRLFFAFSDWCDESDKPLVLIIDEVDSASNNQVFLDFLAQLRLQFLDRGKDLDATAFQSVILAGVTDVQHLRSKIREEDQHKVNSPWNIATAFEIDMSLSAKGIAGMLDEYENDHSTGMDTAQIAQEIYSFTGGYPFLVSRICQLIDTQLAGEARFPDLPAAWTVEGVSEAVRRILNEKNTLFDSLMGKIQNDLELMEMVQQILFEGDLILYNSYQINISDAEMYGFIRNEHGKMLIANRIFETLLYNYYLRNCLEINCIF